MKQKSVIILAIALILGLGMVLADTILVSGDPPSDNNCGNAPTHIPPGVPIPPQVPCPFVGTLTPWAYVSIVRVDTTLTPTPTPSPTPSNTPPPSVTVTPQPPGDTPLVSTSYYISINDVNLGEQSHFYDLGCEKGDQDGMTPGQQLSVVLLLFGQPSREQGTFNYGVILLNYLQTIYMPIDEVGEAGKWFLRGYKECNDIWGDNSFVILSLGVNNQVNMELTYMAFDHGAFWSEMVYDVGQTASEEGLRGSVVGGFDAEPSWNSPDETKEWINGYFAPSIPGIPRLYYFGTAEGCPHPGEPTWTCGGGDYDQWTQEDIWEVAWGGQDVYRWPFPQIYTPNHDNDGQWYCMSVYSYEAHGQQRMYFLGALTQFQACNQPNHSCLGDDNSPEQGWTMLQTRLNADMRTAQFLQYSSDMYWAIEPPPQPGATPISPPINFAPCPTLTPSPVPTVTVGPSLTPSPTQVPLTVTPLSP